MTKLITENLCGVNNIALAAALSGEPFEIVSCAWYEQCNGHSKFIDPASGSMLDLTYCRINPIALGVGISLLVLLILIGIILYYKNKGAFEGWFKPKEIEPTSSTPSSFRFVPRHSTI